MRIETIKVGQAFGRWTVLSLPVTIGKYKRVWCACSCGTCRWVETSNLQNKRSVSCGCFNREVTKLIHTTHGRSFSREYQAWNNMKQRCSDSKRKDYKYYGGKGIKVCTRWLESFANFFADLGPCPPKLTLDRICGDKDYEPDNCRWASWSVQQQNKPIETICRHGGHLLTLENTYINPKTQKRLCKACRHERYLKSRLLRTTP